MLSNWQGDRYLVLFSSVSATQYRSSAYAEPIYATAIGEDLDMVQLEMTY